jgi:hypothetical protein
MPFGTLALTVTNGLEHAWQAKRLVVVALDGARSRAIGHGQQLVAGVQQISSDLGQAGSDGGTGVRVD